MLTIASDAHLQHHPRSPSIDYGVLMEPVEIPERVDRILDTLRAAGVGTIHAPDEFGPEPVLRVHTAEYLEFLATAHAEYRAVTGSGDDAEAVPYARPIRDQPLTEPQHVIGKLGWYSHDNDPIVAGTFAAATAAVDVALTAWQAVARGTEAAAYALCRPPGHHAAADSFAGYCYLNNAAIVANAATDTGARVAILDVDFHHGNGTQQIFYDRDDVLFVSLHADPAEHYPYFLGFANERGWGAGEGYTRNFPLPAGSDWVRYGDALGKAKEAVLKFAPDLLVVSLGVDTAAEESDSFLLTGDDFSRIGGVIAALQRPTVLVQEGGYALDVIGRNVANVLRELA